VTTPRSQGTSARGAAARAKRAHPGDPASEARRLRRVVRACGRAPMPTASAQTPGVGIERPMRARRMERDRNPKERSAAFRERRVEKVIALLEGLDSVELKLTVPEDAHRSTVAALEKIPSTRRSAGCSSPTRRTSA
jgi:hypothetical protein